MKKLRLFVLAATIISVAAPAFAQGIYLDLGGDGPRRYRDDGPRYRDYDRPRYRDRDRYGDRGMSRSLLNIAKRPLPRLTLCGVDLASKDAAG